MARRWACCFPGQGVHTPPCEEEARSNKADGGGKGTEPPPARSGEQPRDHQGLGAPRLCYLDNGKTLRNYYLENGVLQRKGLNI